MIIYNFIKKYYNDLLEKNITVFKYLKSEVNDEIYIKALTLYNEYANKYQRPTLILNEIIEDGIKYWEGSGRGYEFFEPITDFKSLFDGSNPSLCAI